MAHIADNTLQRIISDLQFSMEADSYTTRQRLVEKVIKNLKDALPKPKFRLRAIATPYNVLHEVGTIDEGVRKEFWDEAEAQAYIRKYHRNGVGKECWFVYYEEIK